MLEYSLPLPAEDSVMTAELSFSLISVAKLYMSQTTLECHVMPFH